MADGLDDELARFEAEMRSLEGGASEAPEPEAAPAPAPALAPAPRPAAAVVSAPAARASATIGGAAVPASAVPPPVPPVPPPHPPAGLPAMPMPPIPPPMPPYGMPQMYAMPPQMPPPPQFHMGMQTAMDPAVLAHMRQQMGAAAAANATAVINAQQAAKATGGQRTVQTEVDVTKLHFREVAGEKWVDPSLSEWPDNDFRIFVGNLGTEVNDDVITRAFNKYSSFNMAKVVRDKSTKKSKGYGFASFSDQAEMYKVLKEMEGKYIGNRPCKLKKSTWDKREAAPTEDDVQTAVKRLKTNPTGGTKTAKDRRKHINLITR